MRRIGFFALAAAAGALFFFSLPALWPLADVPLGDSPATTLDSARKFLVSTGRDLGGFRGARSWVMLREIDHVDRTLGRERTQRLIRDGLPVVYWQVDFKKRGETVTYRVNVHPRAGVIGWFEDLEEDTPGATIENEAARRLALAAIADLQLEGNPEELAHATIERLARRDHRFTFRYDLSTDPPLEEWVYVSVSGDVVSAVNRAVRVPPEARRAERAARGPVAALEAAGYGLLAVAGLCGLIVFLRRLRDGRVELRRAAFWPAVVFVCLLVTVALQSGDLLRAWDPLWSFGASLWTYLVYAGMSQAALPLLLLAVVGAGNAVNDADGAGRGGSLELLRRGRLLHESVAAASRRGFLVGLMCGGTLAGAVLLLEQLPGTRIALQPRHFFTYPLDSSAPALITVLFFLGIALAEELGYRYFGGAWLYALTGRRWIAIWAPALIYGLAHTNLGFLPPAEPFWGRAAVMTLVGAVWGWAFFRFDALTVVLSHFTADLFIFNWPRVAGGDPGAVATSMAAICVPLVPALLHAVRPRRRRGAGGAAAQD